MSADTSLLKALRDPLIAILLGIAPYWVFIGASQTASYNGQVIQSSRFNLLGCILGLIGLVIAIKALVKRKPTSRYRWLVLGLSAAAVIVCVVQIGAATEFFKVYDIKQLAERALANSPPIHRPSAGLDAAAEAEIRNNADHLDEPLLLRSIGNAVAFLNGAIVRRDAYSTTCQLKVESEPLAPTPPYLTEAGRKQTEEYVEAMRQRPAPTCSEASTKENIDELGDEIAKNRAELNILEDGYIRRFGARGSQPSGSADGQPAN